MITVVALGKSKFGSIRGYINPFWASFFYFLRFFLSFLQFFILESCYIWFKLSLQYPSEYVYIFALVKFKIWVYLVVCKPCFEPYCPFSEIFFYFFNFSLESFWVCNAVLFSVTRAVGPFSLRLVSFKILWVTVKDYTSWKQYYPEVLENQKFSPKCWGKVGSSPLF